MTTPTQQPSVQISKSEDYFEVYANTCNIGVTLMDFLIQFGQAHQNGAEVKVELLQGIWLSPQQAKALCMILTQNVQSYEQNFGEIKLAPQAGGRIVTQ